jgi:hypothetical protein
MLRDRAARRQHRPPAFSGGERRAEDNTFGARESCWQENGRGMSEQASACGKAEDGRAPLWVWCEATNYTRVRGNVETRSRNCPKGQAKAGRNTAKRGERN